MKVSCLVSETPIITQVCNAMDYTFNGAIQTDLPDFTLPDNSFGIGLILGASGTGKSTILNALGDPVIPVWDNSKAVVDHFKSFDDARERLGASGLNSIPTWVRPYSTLSNGEQYRADLSRQIQDNARIDEFTSVVDRNVAKSCATSLSKYVKREGIKGVVIASCHYDVADWLEPDWIFDCSVSEFTDRGSLHRPSIKISLAPSTTEAWALFSKHHYLTRNINKSARCWLAIWDNLVVGFVSAIAFPSGSVKNAWREHRTVVLPEFQGMGIGSRISDAVGEIFIKQGCRYFSKTAHPNFGRYRQSSTKWKPTSKNMKSRPDYNHSRNTKEDKYKHLHTNRWCYSHEYIGGSN